MTTTASQWLADHPGDIEKLEEMLLAVDVPIDILTEMPLWMKESISEQLQDTFDQPYWKGISEATKGDAEFFVEQGLQEGWSINRIASEMAPSFAGSTAKYAKRRGVLIARTESGHSLNAVRKTSMDKLAEEMGPEVPMKPVWLSVLGNTTRDAHAHLDGVPADKDGMWNLNGVRIPWPSHISLPAADRCNCQCTITTSFGANEAEAIQLIQGHEERIRESGD